jgi:WD40 repeat protein
VVFAPDGEVLAVAQADGNVSLWDAVDRRPIGRVRRSNDVSITTLAAGGSAGSWRLAAAYDDGTLTVTEVTGDEALPEPIPLTSADTPVDLALNTSGQELAVLTASGVDYASADTDWQLEPAGGASCAIPLSPIGIDYIGRGLVAVAAQDGSVEICETAPSAVSFEASAIYAVAIDPEGERVVSGDEAGGLITWDLGETLVPGQSYGGSDGGDLGATVVPAASSGSTEEGHVGYVNDVVYSRDGTRFASASADGQGAIWDVDGGDPTWLEGHRGLVLGIAFAPDGNRVATAGTDGTVRLWNANTGRTVREISAHENGAWDVAFSPRGDVLASVGKDEVVRLWDANSGDALGTLPRGSGHTDLVISVDFDPDGERLATTSADGTTIIWDVDDREMLHQLDDHNGVVLSAAFHPTEELVATASDDNTVLLYDLSSGDVERRIELPSDAHSVAFTPDGEDIVVGTGSGRIVVDPMDVDELVERAQERAGRELTTDECEQFLHEQDCAADDDIGY